MLRRLFDNSIARQYKKYHGSRIRGIKHWYLFVSLDEVSVYSDAIAPITAEPVVEDAVEDAVVQSNDDVVQSNDEELNLDSTFSEIFEYIFNKVFNYLTSST